jgi:hypothetical protein
MDGEKPVQPDVNALDKYQRNPGEPRGFAFGRPRPKSHEQCLNDTGSQSNKVSWLASTRTVAHLYAGALCSRLAYGAINLKD